LAKASDGTEGGWVSTRVACTATKEYESSCTFEPCLTCSNALRRVQNPGSSLVTPAGSSGRSSRPACRWRRPGDPAPPPAQHQPVVVLLQVDLHAQLDRWHERQGADLGCSEGAMHYLDPVPIHELQERWIDKVEAPRLRAPAKADCPASSGFGDRLQVLAVGLGRGLGVVLGSGRLGFGAGRGVFRRE